VEDETPESQINMIIYVENFELIYIIIVGYNRYK
jgi:hypothetical protein